MSYVGSHQIMIFSRKRKPSENKKTNNLRSHADDDRTVFFKNVPFIVDNEQLKECAEKYAGAVEYAVICMDPLTEHSKGTAFVRFIVCHWICFTFRRKLIC